MRTLLEPQDFQGLIVDKVLAVAAVNVAIARFHSCDRSVFVRMAYGAAAPTEAVRLCLKVQVAVGLGHDAGALQTQEQGPQRHDIGRVGRGIVRLGDYTRLLVDILQYGAVVLQRLLARVVEHFAHVLCLAVSDVPRAGQTSPSHLPHPYSMCAIWLLGTMLPLAFLTILGEASADAFWATAIVSMVPTQDGCVYVVAGLRLYMLLQGGLSIGGVSQRQKRNSWA